MNDKKKGDPLFHLADALVEDIETAPSEKLFREVAEDQGDSRAFVGEVDQILSRVLSNLSANSTLETEDSAISARLKRPQSEGAGSRFLSEFTNWLESLFWGAGRTGWAAVAGLLLVLLLAPSVYLNMTSEHERVSLQSRSVRTGMDGPFVPPPGRSHWLVENSTVFLEPTGDRRQFFLIEPSRELIEQGAQSGALLFDGQKTAADRYEGKLIVFAGRCGTRDYDAIGTLANNDETITFVGRAPRIDSESCIKIGDQERVLVIKYLHSLK